MDELIQKPKTTPKDFFLYLSAMIALYVSVISLLTLLFQYTNVLFPDVLDYRISYSSQIRFAIASLIIIFPLYIFLTRLLNKDLRLHPEKKDIWIRKWLIYLTLFIGGITIIVDLVALINTFLGGEITTRFILKVLAILIIVGDVFLYYLFDLRGKWEREEKLSKTIGWVSGIIVLAVIIGGFFIIGTPQSQRLLRFDEEKVQDLSNIQFQIVEFWREKERLPNDLDELEDPLVGFIVQEDPQTDEPYTYRIIGTLTFELCADFNKASDNAKSQAFPIYQEKFFLDENWEHKEGETCFERTIDPERFLPLKEVR
jgi:hypothetical protein